MIFDIMREILSDINEKKFLMIEENYSQRV